MAGPFEPIEHRLFGPRGAFYEGDAFSIMAQVPFVLRSFEFARADGAIDCNNEYNITATFADRYWSIYQQRFEDVKLMLFDVKSTSHDSTGDGRQVFLTDTIQRREVAFYVCVCAADPTHVELVPNYQQVSAAEEEDEGIPKRQLIVRTARRSTLPPIAYCGLDQSGAPYRMPIAFLREAMGRVRRVARGEEDVYINPWSGAAFPDWRPLTTTSTQHLRPMEDTGHASAYEAAMDIYRMVHFGDQAWTGLDLDMDFIGLQPALADFKLISAGTERYVQHKLNVTVRALDSKLHKVAISRGQGDSRHFYFSSSDRFDFLWHQFTFSTGPPTTRTEFFFMPEYELPDVFFTTMEAEADYSLYPNFGKYRIIMDAGGRWLLEVERILKENPHPRKAGQRPSRNKKSQAAADADTSPPPETQIGAVVKSQPRRVALTTMHRQFFYRVMGVCARRHSGLLVVLSRNHNLGDFGFVRYRWQLAEVEAFLERGVPPKAAHHLPSAVEVVPISCYTQHAPTSFEGPMMRGSHFRRLDSRAHPRLLVWDIAGSDSSTFPLAVVPTEDIQVTDTQRATLARDLNSHVEGLKTPSVSSLLKTGLYLAEYAVGSSGIVGYEEDHWESLWSLLDKFSLPGSVAHPPGYQRCSADYRHTLQVVNNELRKQHGMFEGVDDDDGDDGSTEADES